MLFVVMPAVVPSFRVDFLSEMSSIVEAQERSRKGEVERVRARFQRNMMRFKYHLA